MHDLSILIHRIMNYEEIKDYICGYCCAIVSGPRKVCPVCHWEGDVKPIYVTPIEELVIDVCDGFERELRRRPDNADTAWIEVWLGRFNNRIIQVVGKATSLNYADEEENKKRISLIYIIKQYLLFSLTARFNAFNKARDCALEYSKSKNISLDEAVDILYRENVSLHDITLENYYNKYGTELGNHCSQHTTELVSQREISMDDLSGYIKSVECYSPVVYNMCNDCESIIGNFNKCPNCGGQNVFPVNKNVLNGMVYDSWTIFKNNNVIPSDDDAEAVASWQIEKRYNPLIEKMVYSAADLSALDEDTKKIMGNLLIYIVRQYLIFEFTGRVKAHNDVVQNSPKQRTFYGISDREYEALFYEWLEKNGYNITLSEYYAKNKEQLHNQEQTGIAF